MSRREGGQGRLAVFLNPAAGRGRARRICPEAVRCLEGLGLETRVYRSEAPGHLTELARGAAAGGYDALVACGGDGTFHEMINGLGVSDGHTPRLGIIPAGTGDDLAVNLGIPRDVGRACRTLAGGSPRRFDLASSGGRLYACVAGAGFDSMVNRAANSGSKWLRGTSVYVWAMLKTLASFSPPQMEIEADGWRWSGRAMFAVAANAASYGGGMRIAPHARMDDGLLDLVLVEEISKAELLRVFPRVYGGGHIGHPRIIHRRASRITFSSPRELELFGDGEYLSKLPATIEVLPGALEVIVPP